MPDDVLPNDGSTFYQPEEPQEQAEARRAEQSKVRAGMPMLDEVIERLKARIIFYDSVDSINSDARTPASVFQKAWQLNRGMKRALQEELEYFEKLKELATPQE